MMKLPNMGRVQNMFGGKIYAQLYEDSKGMCFIEYFQKYKNGTFSPKIRLPQADMRIAARFGFISKGIPGAKGRNRVAGLCRGIEELTTKAFMRSIMHQFVISIKSEAKRS